MNGRAMILGWLLSALVGAVGLRVAPSFARDRLIAPYGAPAPATPASAETADPGGEHPWTMAPFRAGRVPPEVRYAADALVAAQRFAEVDSVTAPTWTVTGVVLGARPIALLDGAGGPEMPTRLVAIGDDVGAYRIDDIRADTVVVSRGDVSWTLTLQLRGGAS